jgi:hypothetical protein
MDIETSMGGYDEAITEGERKFTVSSWILSHE